MYKYKRNRNEYEQWFEMNKNELRVQKYQGNNYKCLITEKLQVWKDEGRCATMWINQFQTGN